MAMKYVAAYLMAVMGGNANPKAADIDKILSSVGTEMEPEVVEMLIKSMKGKTCDEVIAAGMSKLMTVPTGGGGGAAPAAATKDAPVAAKAKEVVKEEPEEDEDMGFSLFD